MWNSIRTRLTITFFALTIGPLLITGIILTQRIYIADQSLAYNLQTQAAQDASDEIETSLREITSSLVDLANDVRTAQFVYGDDDLAQQRLEMNISLTRAIATGPHSKFFEELAVLNGEGEEWIVLTHEENVPIRELGDRKDLDEFNVPKSTRFTYSSPILFDNTTGKPLITIAFPIFRGTELKVVLVAKVRFNAIGDLLGGISAGEDQTIYITDGNGNLLAHQNPTVQLQDLKIALPTQANTQAGLNGENVILATNEILFGDQSIFLIAEKPVAKALTVSGNTRITIAILVVASILVAGLFGLLAIRQIVVPIEELANTAENITAGDYTLRANVQRKDEIGALGTAFNAMTSQLREFIGSLEQRVAERTSELEIANQQIERRAEQFEAIAQVSRIISSIQKQEELLPRITHMISHYFGFYHVGIFLLDDNKQYAYLRAANSPGGRRMLARQHRLAVGQTGIVGYVTATGNPRIALDVGADAVFFNNPDLPDTRSEMALPLKSGNQIIGALDVQSTESNAFTQEDINILSTLADQVSVAIRNAILFDESREALAQAETAYSQLTSQTWSNISRLTPVAGYHFDGLKAEPLTGSTNGKKAKGQEEALSVPVQLRGTSIGQLHIKARSKGYQWTEDEIAIVRATAERVALAAENARLIQESQKSAAKEQVIGEISSKIGASINLDNILKTTLREMGRILPGAEISIQVEKE